MRIGIRIAGVVLGLIVVACGGSSLPTIAVSVQPSKLEATFRGGGQAFNPPSASGYATLHEPPTTSVYLQIIEDAPILASNPVGAFYKDSNGKYYFELLFNRNLSGGTYTGTLKFKLCQDQGCTSSYPLTGNDVPYELTVAAPVTVTAYVNGSLADANSLEVHSGAQVRIESSEPSNFSEGMGGAYATNVVRTASSWEGQVNYGLSTPGGTGVLELSICSIAEPQGGPSVIISVTE